MPANIQIIRSPSVPQHTFTSHLPRGTYYISLTQRFGWRPNTHPFHIKHSLPIYPKPILLAGGSHFSGSASRGRSSLVYIVLSVFQGRWLQQWCPAVKGLLFSDQHQGPVQCITSTTSLSRCLPQRYYGSIALLWREACEGFTDRSNVNLHTIVLGLTYFIVTKDNSCVHDCLCWQFSQSCRET